jgi:hypothetical protein
MAPSFSIPTDNIYKFFALFGFVLLVSSMLAFIYVHDFSHSNMIKWVDEIIALGLDGKRCIFLSWPAEMA